MPRWTRTERMAARAKLAAKVGAAVVDAEVVAKVSQDPEIRRAARDMATAMRVYLARQNEVSPPVPERPLATRRCGDCGARGETTGHQTCQYPQNH